MNRHRVARKLVFIGAETGQNAGRGPKSLSGSMYKTKDCAKQVQHQEQKYVMLNLRVYTRESMESRKEHRSAHQVPFLLMHPVRRTLDC